jgi:membrane fusion protein, multidrug efflux system
MAESAVEPIAEPARGRGLPHRKRRLAAFVLAGGAAIVAVGATLTWLHFSVRESTDDAQIEANIVPIGLRVGGTIKEVLVGDNQRVEAGAVLVRIDPADHEVALRKAEAEAADARAAAAAARAAIPITTTNSASQTSTADAGVSAARQEVEAASARLAEARSGHERARSDLDRYAKLVDREEISRQQFDAAVAAEAASASAVAEAEAGLAAARSHVVQAEAAVRAAGTAGSQVEVARAKADAADAIVRKDEAVVEQARLNLGYTTVTAPIAGIVSRKSVQPGQTVQPGQQILAIVPLDTIWVVANFKEGQLRRMRPGQPVEVYVDAYKRAYQAHVESIGGTTAGKFSLLPPENASGNFVKVVQRVPVKIVLDGDQDPGHLLRPGMSVVPTVLTR